MPPLLIGCWFTFSFLVTRDGRSLWLVAGFWVAPGVYLGWILWCHATGRDELARRVDRWGDDHPRMYWMIIGVIFVACIVLWLLRS